MKYRVLLAAVASVCLYETPAQADSEASMELTIEGFAEQVCVLPEPTQIQSENAGFTGGQIIEIDQMIDQADATLNKASIRLEFPGVMCNYPAKVFLTTANGGLVRTGSNQTQAVSGSGGLIDRVDYRVSGSWGSVQLPNFSTTSVSAGHTASVEAGGANLADLIIDITIDQQDTPVLTGQYSDDIHVKVGLQP